MGFVLTRIMFAGWCEESHPQAWWHGRHEGRTPRRRKGRRPGTRARWVHLSWLLRRTYHSKNLLGMCLLLCSFCSATIARVFPTFESAPFFLNMNLIIYLITWTRAVNDAREIVVHYSVVTICCFCMATYLSFVLQYFVEISWIGSIFWLRKPLDAFCWPVAMF